MAKLHRTLILDKRVRAGLTAPRQYLTGVDVLHSHVGVPTMWVFKKGFDVAVAERALGETLGFLRRCSQFLPPFFEHLRARIG